MHIFHLSLVHVHFLRPLYFHSFQYIYCLLTCNRCIQNHFKFMIYHFFLFCFVILIGFPFKRSVFISMVLGNKSECPEYNYCVDQQMGQFLFNNYIMSSRFLSHHSWQGDSSSQISKSRANNLIVYNGK